MDLVKTVLKELEGSFVFVSKSIHFSNEVITTVVNFIDVKYATAEDSSNALEGRTYCLISAQPYLTIP
ncbi:hypothetical protein M422DRAFT_35270 [Sphaerobolus stellatus SS14]|uniref:Uncharacterized protein n=1 Tax=Sphaerobolus stellatus (strain SS14) TaxID=990650 RepID=A0A0C9UGS8_SPHS4|nr:hypothetical protein M422DRAFT_35270 [Sphaerobolus stellatus SS14]